MSKTKIPTASEVNKLIQQNKPTFLEGLLSILNSGIQRAINQNDHKFSYEWPSCNTKMHIQYREARNKLYSYYKERGYKFSHIPAHQGFLYMYDRYLIEW